MLIQEIFDRMDWVTYGNDQKNKGLDIGIRGTVKAMRDLGQSDSKIIDWIMNEYNFPRTRAEHYLSPVS